MTTFNQKHQIMQSLESLDPRQTAKVLDYVRSLARPAYTGQTKKQEGLRQIRQALTNAGAVNSAF